MSIQIKQPTKLHLTVFVAGITMLLFLFSQKTFKAGKGNLSLLLICLAITLLILYLTKKDFVIQFYMAWMRVVSCIGLVVTSIIMVALFYLVFSPIAIVLRILKKDLLHLKRDPRRKTYWIDRPHKKQEKTSYERIF